eukprot:CAMPEP_0119322152 /NCGR_PEP_ID=MMETSP1333-20130426/57415_1 /TAXON_ID=418940 /ORGANISM="Scyphosphaera apsteinii, Strain RCC1455" /LENGTH=95 /DNA_ID=CAMNT_0007329301 /DNA_START=37 /DNA_END=321 /DNA_ORIENTATION=+
MSKDSTIVQGQAVIPMGQPVFTQPQNQDININLHMLPPTAQHQVMVPVSQEDMNNAYFMVREQCERSKAPVVVKCPHCQQTGLTRIRYKVGESAW